MKRVIEAVRAHGQRIRRLILAGALAVSGVALAACDAATTAAEIQTIRDTTLQVCSYVPSVQSLETLLNVFVPSTTAITSVADQISNQICSAVSKSSARRGVAAPIVIQGVQITGTYVTK